jgi:hypothetical protein
LVKKIAESQASSASPALSLGRREAIFEWKHVKTHLSRPMYVSGSMLLVFVGFVVTLDCLKKGMQI